MRNVKRGLRPGETEARRFILPSTPGYPLSVCSPALPDSVSPGTLHVSVSEPDVEDQPALTSRHNPKTAPTKLGEVRIQPAKIHVEWSEWLWKCASLRIHERLPSHAGGSRAAWFLSFRFDNRSVRFLRFSVPLGRAQIVGVEVWLRQARPDSALRWFKQF